MKKQNKKYILFVKIIMIDRNQTVNCKAGTNLDTIRCK